MGASEQLYSCYPFQLNSEVCVCVEQATIPSIGWSEKQPFLRPFHFHLFPLHPALIRPQPLLPSFDSAKQEAYFDYKRDKRLYRKYLSFFCTFCRSDPSSALGQPRLWLTWKTEFFLASNEWRFVEDQMETPLRVKCRYPPIPAPFQSKGVLVSVRFFIFSSVNAYPQHYNVARYCVYFFQFFD